MACAASATWPVDDLRRPTVRRLADSTGVDLNNPPQMTLPELTSGYDSTEMATA
jgi:hypothetical protein